MLCLACKSQKKFHEMAAGGMCLDCAALAKEGRLPVPSLEERAQKAHQSGDFSDLTHEEISLLAADVILTTSMFVAGKEIENELEIITSEVVFGMNIFRDFFAGVRDIFGGRSAATQTVLRDARKAALSELRREALMVGADAVIAIDLDYQELAGGGKSGMLMIVASGTAVRLS